jgi:hypothetical protein
MKSPILRLFATTFVLALLVGILISIVGWFLGWNTSTQFSNGLFITGGVIIVIGLFSTLGGYNKRSDSFLAYTQSAGNMNLEERTRRMAADMLQEYRAVVFLTLTGGFMIGMAILVGSLF